MTSELIELTVIVPCFNEQATVAQVIRRIAATLGELQCQVIVVDDGSTDGF